MQGEQPMNGETGFLTAMKGISVWIIAGIAHFIENINAQQVAVWLSIAYTTLLIVSWFRREFRTPARQVRMTDTVETIKAKKVIVELDGEEELPHPPHIPKD